MIHFINRLRRTAFRFMAFEKRRGNVYYYRKQRIGKRVRSIYISNNNAALIINHQTFMSRINAISDRDDQQERRREADALDTDLDALAAKTAALVTATLLSNGFHQHKREWRRKRK